MAYQKITLLLLLTSVITIAQKKPITHKDYDLWKKINKVTISDQGKLIVSVIETTTGRGDGYIEIYDTSTAKKTTFFNGYDPTISFDEKYVVFKVKPKYEDVRNVKKKSKKKVKEEDLPKDKLFIYDVLNIRIHDSISRVSQYNLPKKSSKWMIIEKFKNKNKKNVLKKTKIEDTTAKKKVPLDFKQKYGLVYTFETKRKDTLLQLKDLTIPEKGNVFYFSRTSKSSKKTAEAKERDLGVYQFNVEKAIETAVDTSKYLYSQLALSTMGNHFTYISAKDSTAVDSLSYELFHYTKETLSKLVDFSGKNLVKGWELSGDQAPFFSENEEKLYFYSKPKKKYNRDTTLLKEEIPQVDVWHWQDKMIQPEQKSKSKELDKKAFLSYYSLTNDKVVHLQDEQIDELIFDKDENQAYILGATGNPYDIERSWNSPWSRDFYVINTVTGQKRLGIKNIPLRPYISKDGRYALYFDIRAQHWFSLNLQTLETQNLTKDIQVPLYDEDDDHPMLPYPHGFGGFDTEGRALIFDKFDIWRVSLKGDKSPENITKTGRKKNIEYRTKKLNPEYENNASYINNGLLISGFDKNSKASGIFVLKKGKLIEKIKPKNFLIRRFTKAKDADVLTFTQENFNTYPDLYYSKKSLDTYEKITAINSQQKNFKWGSAELFSWTAYDGTPLEGILYKPENFDASKKYPMITYFYEKRSDRYHNYIAPQPSASTVNPTYLVSNDYIMFVPDIVYKEGEPGPSAYNCVVSGVEAVEKLGFIDTNNMALQGQSWGGYQVAYLITVTDKFKAAMAGAPVSNMFSAYGGIRWKTGLSRAFQYEKTQSRIGKNIWEGFDLYVKNSPLFGIPKIETPLLMMHNDKDGAVPYYQGIEMFMGMRRLQKPVWLLVYNDEAHNLKKVKNKQDLSIRMMQFFDHYLKGQSAPEWMTKGVSRTQKGKDFGYATDK
ncbi:S9 family peptidase [Aquimarina sp. U1-2]|uniref:alpha/beta hydrolase family protein n=1 Tax=Aquimarina sp. U1-2 TaxID=2823141 RepID=UPI001AECD7D4|nr:prolyl oligopeptidase family serine peptidase [Aquimarina sp. U1-2]MBP2833545.1 S9 family peptidase [Aquimarina sp. U1-2]